jgi:DNA-binding GntR family transcriptional regulator
MAVRTSIGDRPEAMQDYAARHIERAILTGALRPGAKLSPSALAQELRMSHIPVREALAALEASGHVVREPRRGFFVADLSRQDMEDVYRWRAVLEDEAHRLAVPHLTRADLARMRKVDRELARTAPFSPRYLDLNREFHFVVFDRAESENLLRFLNHLWDAAMRYQSVMSGRDLPALRHHHHGLIEAYAARDVERVNALMAEHRHTALAAFDDTCAVVEEQGA